MRGHRPKHRDLDPVALAKARARSYATTYQRRGLIERGPCVRCGNPRAQNHHRDYSKPLDVIRLCRGCRLEEHRDGLPPAGNPA